MRPNVFTHQTAGSYSYTVQELGLSGHFTVGQAEVSFTLVPLSNNLQDFSNQLHVLSGKMTFTNEHHFYE